MVLVHERELRAPVDPHPAARGLETTEHQLHQGRLPVPVLADEHVPGLGVDDELVRQIAHPAEELFSARVREGDINQLHRRLVELAAGAELEREVLVLQERLQLLRLLLRLPLQLLDLGPAARAGGVAGRCLARRDVGPALRDRVVADLCVAGECPLLVRPRAGPGGEVPLGLREALPDAGNVQGVRAGLVDEEAVMRDHDDDALGPSFAGADLVR
mmetsp:Transcript_46800/g.133953  ORF Transcript_46800/g.133953 Transcript_46800/m.133953 type:complete len:216 (+) Transcript_46800:768-1415(+)